MKESLFYERLEGKQQDVVQCRLCPHNCIIADGKTGICGVRQNNKGRLFSLVYGRLCSMNVDPIEKKPLFHFAPGTNCLSICTVGCNLTCRFCQNYDISHPSTGEIFGEEITPESVIDTARQQGLPGIAYTYTEPTIAWEFYFEVMKLARKEGLYNVWVSNGYINPEPARKIAKYMDAINVDLKGDIGFYKKLCGVPSEKPMHESLKIYKKAGVCIEITNLIIPGFNDKPGQVETLAKWVKENLGKETPFHISRFYPNYKMSGVEPTPIKTLESAADTARKTGIRYVYIGNVPGEGWEDTRCPKCGTLIIKRSGLSLSSFKDTCDKCKLELPIAGRKWMGKE
jgi:pyruvate formate lyase activating enzyme